MAGRLRYLQMFVPACAAVLLAAGCGVSDRINEAKDVGGKVKYGALVGKAMTRYGSALAQLDTLSAQGELPTAQDAATFSAAAEGVREAAVQLHGIDPPKGMDDEHQALVAAVEKAARALEGMAAATRNERPRLYRNWSQLFATSQEEIGSAITNVARAAGIDLPPPAPVTVPG